MSRFMWLFFGLGLFALGVGTPHVASAGQTAPDVHFTMLGSLDLSQGTTAATLTSASFKNMASASDTPAALPGSLIFAECMFRNSHASQNLFVGIAAYSGAGPVTTNRIKIGPGASIFLPIYGMAATSISIDADGAATTGQIVCGFVPRVM